jgi:hypothetical protein
VDGAVTKESDDAREVSCEGNSPTNASGLLCTAGDAAVQREVGGDIGAGLRGE